MFGEHEASLRYSACYDTQVHRHLSWHVEIWMEISHLTEDHLIWEHQKLFVSGLTRGTTLLLVTGPEIIQVIMFVHCRWMNGMFPCFATWNGLENSFQLLSKCQKYIASFKALVWHASCTDVFLEHVLKSLSVVKQCWFLFKHWHPKSFLSVTWRLGKLHRSLFLLQPLLYGPIPVPKRQLWAECVTIKCRIHHFPAKYNNCWHVIHC